MSFAANCAGIAAVRYSGGGPSSLVVGASRGRRASARAASRAPRVAAAEAEGEREREHDAAEHDEEALADEVAAEPELVERDQHARRS